jgi:hypothetical protein
MTFSTRRLQMTRIADPLAGTRTRTLFVKRRRA